MKIAIRRKGYWAAGILVSAVGLILAKLVAPHSAHDVQRTISLIGIGFALGGLVIITFGTRKRRS